MNAKIRLLTAWRFAEPDLVPLEIYLYPPARGLPGADRIQAFQEQEADNLRGVAGFDWGFMGLDTTYTEQVIAEETGFKRLLRTHSTPVGDFTAITGHNLDDADPNDYHWEKRYIETLDDFKRLVYAERRLRPFNGDAYNRGCAEVGHRGLPCTGLFHPLGRLVRDGNMAEVMHGC